jgi:hypothetical protein
MKKLFLLLLVLILSSCEKYVTEISDLTLSGKYVITKMTVITISHSIKKDTTYLSGGIFRNNSLPHPFSYIKVNEFYFHFTYSEVRMNWINRIQTGSNRDMWEYGSPPNEIFYHRLPYSYNAYDFGKIQFDYKPTNENTYRRITFHIDSDLLETVQLSGLDIAPYGKDGPAYRFILTLSRVGP